MKIRRTIKIVMVAIVAAMTGFSALADPVTENMAITMVNKWLNDAGKTGYTAYSADAVKEGEVILYYAVKCKPKGVVIVAPDNAY